MKQLCSLCKEATNTSCPVCIESGEVWFCCADCNKTIGFKEHLKTHAKKTKQYMKERSEKKKKKKKTQNVEGDKRPPEFGNPDPKKKKPNPEYIVIDSSSEEKVDFPLPGDSVSSEESNPGYEPASPGPSEWSEGSGSESKWGTYNPQAKSSEEEESDDSPFEPSFSGPSTPPYVPKSPVLPNPGIKKWGPNPDPNPPLFYPPPPVPKQPVYIPPQPPAFYNPPQIQPEPPKAGMESWEEEEDEDEDVAEERDEPVADPRHLAPYKYKVKFRTEESHAWEYQEIMNLSTRWNNKVDTVYEFLTYSDDLGLLMERGLKFGPDAWLSFFGDFPIAAAMFLLRRAMPRFIVTISGERKHPLVMDVLLNELEQEIFETIESLPTFDFPVKDNANRRSIMHIFFCLPNLDNSWEIEDTAMWKLIARDLSSGRKRSLIRRHRTLIKNFFYYHAITYYGNIYVQNEERKRMWFGNIVKGTGKFAFEAILKNLYAVALAASKVDYAPPVVAFDYSLLKNAFVQPVYNIPIPEVDYQLLTPFVKQPEQ